MKTKTDFAKYLSKFFQEYLPHERNVSINTSLSYRDAFVQFIDYMRDKCDISVERLHLADYTKKNILAFLKALVDRGCSESTRNYRLAAFKSFARYLQYYRVENLSGLQDILMIPALKTECIAMNYLSVEEIKLLLSQPNPDSIQGLRHLVILSLLYETGARVQEVCDLTVGSLRIEYEPYTIKLFGKGRKGRIVPLSKDIVILIKKYLKAYNLDNNEKYLHPLFFNNRHEKLTRAGISYIMERYITSARMENHQMIPQKCSCHTLRHSRAMHLLQSGVNLVYIRDILGHTSITTTEIYAKIDSRHKQEAIENAYAETIPIQGVSKLWEQDQTLRDWLKSF